MGTLPDVSLSGTRLAAAFHRDLVGPLLARELPGLRYATARLGSGSDVLGLDDETSQDHDWGCRLTLLVDGPDAAVLPRVDAVLAAHLPDGYRGRPVRFATTWDPRVTHRVDLDTVAGFATGRLGVDPTGPMSTVDWLVLSGQSVLEVTAGEVFVDRTATLSRVRERLRWYPPDVERYVLAAGWQRLSEYLPILGRAGQRGDRLGARLLSTGLAEDLVRQAFLLARAWAPYPKWLGTRFAALPIAAALAGPLDRATGGTGWADREAGLVAAVDVLLAAQRERGLPTPEVGVTAFFDRPFHRLDDRVVSSLLDGLTDPWLAGQRYPIGSIDQWVTNVGVLTRPVRRAFLATAYRAWLQES
jgi:hypothetical protein